MKKASKVLIGVLSVGALIGTGFAAWTINKGYTKAEAPGFTPDVIVNNNSSFGKFIVTQVEEKNEAGEIVSPIKFDAPREVYNNGQKLPFDPGEEDLEVTYNLRAESDNGHPVDPYTLGSVNRHAYDGIATEYIPDVSISTKVVDAQKQEVSAEVLAEIKEYVALPEDVSERQMQIPYERWLAADKKETGYNHTLRFGWGSLTHGENPQLYFIKEENKVEGKDLSESFEAYINKLNEVVKTSGIQFVFTFEIGGVEIFEANTSLISIVEGLGADLHVTHEGQEVKNGDELEIGAVVNVSASALEGYENPVITFNGKVIEAGEVTIVKGANEFGVTATKVTEPVDPTEKVFSGTLNGQSIDLTDVKPVDSPNKVEYKLTLAIGDKVSFKYGDDVLGFYHRDNEVNKAVKDGEEFIAAKAGEHTFYINSDNQVYVGEPTGPVEPVENPKYYLVGGFNDWDASEDYILNEVEGVYHFELTIAAKATAEFKVLGPNDTWYGETTLNGGENFKWVNNENEEVKIDIAFYPEKNADGKYIVASLVQGETPVDPVLSVEYYLTGKINGEAKWYDSEGVALTDLVKMDAPQDEKNLAEKLELSLKEGDEIKGIIVNKEDDAIKSVIWRGVEPSEENKDGSNYVVPKDGKYNFYLTSTALYVTEVEETPVEEPNDGSLEHPFTAEEAIEVCNGLEPSTKDNKYPSEQSYYVKGIVTKVTEISASYGNATFEIGGFTAFRVYAADYTKLVENYVQVGDEVVIYGQLLNYGTTPETHTGAKIISVMRENKNAIEINKTNVASLGDIYVDDVRSLNVTNNFGYSYAHSDYEVKFTEGLGTVVSYAEGKITALAVGSAKFTVTAKGITSEEIALTVAEKPAVPTELTLASSYSFTNYETHTGTGWGGSLPSGGDVTSLFTSKDENSIVTSAIITGSANTGSSNSGVDALKFNTGSVFTGQMVIETSVAVRKIEMDIVGWNNDKNVTVEIDGESFSITKNDAVTTEEISKAYISGTQKIVFKATNKRCIITGIRLYK